jgi:hypothetical protein
VILLPGAWKLHDASLYYLPFLRSTYFHIVQPRSPGPFDGSTAARRLASLPRIILNDVFAICPRLHQPSRMAPYDTGDTRPFLPARPVVVARSNATASVQVLPRSLCPDFDQACKMQVLIIRISSVWEMSKDQKAPRTMHLHLGVSPRE